MWYPQHNTSHLQIPSDIKAWLFDHSSMTARLRKIAEASFRVQVLFQGWGIAKLAEKKRLQLKSHETVWIREVHLMDDQIPMIYARTIIPKLTLLGQGRHLHYLKERPIIEILQKDKYLRRSEFEIAKIYQGKKIQWARRSVFYFYDNPLLVQEYFLMDLAGGCHPECNEGSPSKAYEPVKEILRSCSE